MPLLGVVENMAGVTCPHCSGEFHLFPRDHLAEALDKAGVASLAQVPFSLALASGSDSGRPAVLAAPDSAEASAFMLAVTACVDQAKANFAAAAADSLKAMNQDAQQAPELEDALAAVPDGQREALRSELAALLGQHSPMPSTGQDDSTR